MLDLIDKNSFEEIYKIMSASFPECERRTREAQLKLFDDARYKVVAQRGERGGLCAFMAYWELDGVTFLEHFAVAEHMRGAGLGGKFLDMFMNLLSGTVCLEVEPPETDIAARRIEFYKRHGFALNDYNYVQPPLNEKCNAQPLMVMSYGDRLTRAQFEDVRKKVYAAVYCANVSDYE